MEDVEELNPNREKLKEKLRKKINNKRTMRSGINKKETQTLSDKIQAMLEFLKQENIDMNTQISESIVEKITSIISLNDVKKVLSQVQDNPDVSDNFKTFLSKIEKFKTP
jgi:uncharacterized protein Smg (DUF494 family)